MGKAWAARSLAPAQHVWIDMIEDASCYGGDGLWVWTISNGHHRLGET